jgi:hypothetical protein
VSRAVRELEVGLPRLAIAQHLALSLNALAGRFNGEHHPLRKVGCIARPRKHVASNRLAVFA